VVRSGGWSYGAWLCRSAERSGEYPIDHFGNVGFRLVRGL